MKNFKLRTRLGLGFGLLTLLLALLTGVSIGRLNQLHDEITHIADDRYPKEQALQQVSYAVMDQARAVRNLILLADPETRKKNVGAIDSDSALIRERLAFLAPRVVPGKERTLLDAVEAALGNYGPFLDDVVGLATKDQRDQALATLFGERYKTQGAYLASLSALSKYEQEQMLEASAQAATVHAQANWTLFAVAGTAVLIALASAVSITRSITVPVTQAMLAADRVAEGDLSHPIVASARDETGLLLQALKRMQAELQTVVSGVRKNADGVATASSQIAQGNQDLSERTEKQASALQQTTASMEQLSVTVKQNSDSARQANQLALSASSVAAKGGEVVNEVVATMHGINDSSKKIADIIGVIDGIAFQTNILALNAAVEAARAGEQGRGFAVVASEVRSLAGRSADAAKEIKSLIATSVERVERGTSLVAQAGATMTEVVTSISRVADIVGEITAASTEQNAGVAQVGAAIAQIDKSTQQNAALVEESAAAAESLKGQAQELVRSVAVFTVQGDPGTPL